MPNLTLMAMLGKEAAAIRKSATSHSKRIKISKPGGAEQAMAHMAKAPANSQSPHRYGRKIT